MVKNRKAHGGGKEMSDSVFLCDNEIIFLEEGGGEGAYDFIETINEGGDPPPHTHKEGWEIFYILEGKFWVKVGEEQLLLAPGELARVPPGVVHSFCKEGEGLHRMLLIYSPAGFAGFFREMGAAMPTLEDFDAEIFRQISKKYGQTVV